MELELRARLVVETPAGERRQPGLPREHLRVTEGGEGQAGGVGEDVAHRHRVLPVGGELRDDVGHVLVEVEQPVVEQLPRRAGDDRAPDRLEDVARLGRGVAVGHEGDELALVRDGDLRRRQRAVLDLESDTPQEHIEPSGVERHVAILRWRVTTSSRGCG